MLILISMTCIFFLFTPVDGQISVQRPDYFSYIVDFIKKCVRENLEKIIIFIDEYDNHENIKQNNIMSNKECYENTTTENNRSNKEIIKKDNNINEKSNTENRNSEIEISNKSSYISSGNMNRSCTEKNERYPLQGSCDRYFECQNGTVEEKQCPDGLLYNHNVKLDVFPCLYPIDVQCPPGSTLQEPIPTKNCPNQYGYFKSRNSFSCGSFVICENGIAYDYNCPEGLAFNSFTYRCEWPDLVADCDVEEFLNYRCPEVPKSNDLNISIGYRSPTDCRIYFSCKNNKPRRLFCDQYFAYDEVAQICAPAFNVQECSEKQKKEADKSIALTSNGEYVIHGSDNYLNNRFVDVNFVPKPPRKTGIRA